MKLFLLSSVRFNILQPSCPPCFNQVHLTKEISRLAVGYHNGGLCLKDRNLVESLFLKGDIQILCTTNTLAHGINLPAHTVVIKSTQHLYVDPAFLLMFDCHFKSLLP